MFVDIGLCVCDSDQLYFVVDILARVLRVWVRAETLWLRSNSVSRGEVRVVGVSRRTACG